MASNALTWGDSSIIMYSDLQTFLFYLIITSHAFYILVGWIPISTKTKYSCWQFSGLLKLPKTEHRL